MVVDEPVEIVAASELVVERLRRAIHLRQYAPGERLPSERKLAESLGVSRVTVREALRTLQDEGYVESRRGATGGPFVVVPKTGTTERLQEILRERREEFESILDYRTVVEGGAAQFAAERRSEEDLELMRSAVGDMRSSKDMTAFRQADSAFHLAIANAAANPLLRGAIERARAAMFLPMDSLEQTFNRAWIGWHQQLLAAIEAGKPRLAAEAMRRHVEYNRREIRALLGVDQDDA